MAKTKAKKSKKVEKSAKKADFSKAAKTGKNVEKSAKKVEKEPKKLKNLAKKSAKVEKSEKSGKKVEKNSQKAEKKNKKPFVLIRPFVYFGRYLKESWAELRQVRWPNRKATWKMVLAVLVYTAIFMILISLLDLFFTWLSNLVLGS